MVIEKEATAAIPPETSQAQSGGVLRVIDACADGLLVMALMGELGIVFANVLARVFFNTSFLWADELARFLLSIIAFIGGAVACRRRGHAFVRVLLNRCPAGMQRVFFALADVLALFITLVAWVASFEFIESSWSERTPIFQIPAATIALPLTVGLALIALYAFNHLRREHGRLAWMVGGVFGVAMAGMIATRGLWLEWFAGDAAITATVTLFILTILIGVPVGFVLLMATASYLWVTDAPSLVSLPQSMVNGTGNYILLAVPFFIF